MHGWESNNGQKACVTASARVWYLEPKWLRCQILHVKILLDLPGRCPTQYQLGPTQVNFGGLKNLAWYDKYFFSLNC